MEIDAEALRISVVNAEANGLAERYFGRSCGEEEAKDERYPLVVANILAGTLVQLEPTLAKRVQPGGEILLSGASSQLVRRRPYGRSRDLAVCL